ncbi:TIGR03986 family CRISPR-associated RAMP protein [Teredinibacter turnerae]|uniref:TIGR03986 family type III CRISPR-associated RAMP protein n=1 Tax=Teredinibacter turnerae TaxID=2426 RepID=UPI000362E243|nr:TIGR03986 family CRISPR-associated RAMP protein [Teredinibacter turnerae]
MTEYHLPYHFIPTTGKINGQSSSRYDWNEISVESDTTVRHDLWQKHAHHGRLVCKLTLQSPTVVGGLQTGPEDATVVKPYTLNGTPAVPGSSLRGMIGSVMETLSQSAMRVLDNTELSTRKPVRDAITAFGMYKQVDGKNYLLPLTTKVIKAEKNEFCMAQEWIRAFGEGKRWCDVLPVLLSGYQFSNERTQITQGSYLDQPTLETFQIRRNNFYYARLGAPKSPVSEPLDMRHNSLEIRGNYLIGQKLAPDCDRPITEAEWKNLKQSERSLYTRGMLFILGIEGRESTMPGTKKYEYFIPAASSPPRVDIEPEALAHFEHLCRLATREQDLERNQPSLPFIPQGYSSIELNHGQIIRFNLNSHGTVSEISWSAIWRCLIDGSVFDFFPAELLPWGTNPDDSKNTNQREKLTPAEAILGVVGAAKHRKKDGTEEASSRNLASRIQFSDALSPSKPKLLPETTLKILGSPKLPCPTFYFKPNNANKNLPLSIHHHRPRGRKYYLHHPLAQVRGQSWESNNDDNPKQKLRVTPLCSGQSFWFHVDFNNLTNAELGLLLTSLSPAKNYWHHLGLGKPLGLGSVTLEVTGLCLIDRHQRYRESNLLAPRFAKAAQLSALTHQEKNTFEAIYPEEAKAISTNKIDWIPDLSLVDKSTHQLLCTLGDIHNLQKNAEVRYPYLEGQEQEESEGFSWFVEYQRAFNPTAKGPKPKPLEDITAGKTLPTLTTLKPKKKGKTS